MPNRFPSPRIVRFFRAMIGGAGIMVMPLRAAGEAGAGQSMEVSRAGIIIEVVVFTLGLVLWSTLIWRTRYRILEWLKDLALQGTRGITSRRLRRVSVFRLLQLVRIGTRLASVGLILTGVFVWMLLVMETLPFTHVLAVRMEHSLFAKIEALLFSAVATVPDLVVIAFIYFIARVAHELLNHYFQSIVQGEVESRVFDRVTAEMTMRLADIGIWVAAVIIAFPYLPGSGSDAFRGVSVLAGLMISIGSANFVSQFTSGLSLIYGRAIRPGDYIETAQGDGVVEHIGLLACSLRSSRDELLSIPHSVVASKLKNFSRGLGGVRFTTEVTIGYDTPWRQVRDLLLAAADDTAGIRAEPAPTVRQASLEDYYVRYELLFTPDAPSERSRLLGRLHEAIQDRFHGAGVQIMSPHYLGDPVMPKIPVPSGKADAGLTS
jgi:small-conductance mechanosensitive channel